MLFDEYRVEDAIALAREEELKKGLKQGMEKGVERERRQNIRNMLSFGMTPEQIAQALELPLETVLRYLSAQPVEKKVVSLMYEYTVEDAMILMFKEGFEERFGKAWKKSLERILGKGYEQRLDFRCAKKLEEAFKLSFEEVYERDRAETWEEGLKQARGGKLKQSWAENIGKLSSLGMPAEQIAKGMELPLDAVLRYVSE
jgi:hypothetical protein